MYTIRTVKGKNEEIVGQAEKEEDTYFMLCDVATARRAAGVHEYSRVIARDDQRNNEVVGWYNFHHRKRYHKDHKGGKGDNV